MSTRLGHQARVALTLSALFGGEAVLWRAGRRLPPLSPDGLGTTLAEADPLALAVGVLRLGALVLGAGLIALTMAGLVARALGAARLVTQVNRWTPPSLRHLLDGALGVGLAATIGLSTPAGASPNGGQVPPGAVTPRLPAEGPVLSLRRLADAPPPLPDPSATIRRLPDGTTVSAPPVSAPSGSSLMPRSGADPTAAPSAPAGTTKNSASVLTPADMANSAAPPGHPAAPPVTTGARDVVVRPGDSFWRLAERHQAERLGRQPTDAEVAACWHDLVARNRDRLVVPDDPDLIFPGQVVQMPCS